MLWAPYRRSVVIIERRIAALPTLPSGAGEQARDMMKRPDRSGRFGRAGRCVRKAASVDTGFGPRDTHLRSGDFFAAETYPEIRVVSTKIRPKGGDDFVVTADVTIKDVTKPVDFDVEFLGFYTGMDGSRRAGFSAKAKVNRKDWGLDWNVALEAGGWLVGDQIKLEVDVALQESIALAA